jgi:hypothetical protein
MRPGLSVIHAALYFPSGVAMESREFYGKLVEARLHAKIIADVKPVAPPRSHTPHSISHILLH